MAKENPYGDIEVQIREQLEKLRECNLQESILASTIRFLDERETRLEKEMVKLDKSVALADVESLLNKLPKNYFAFPELKEIYLNLR